MKIEQAFKPLLLTNAFGIRFAIITTNRFIRFLHNIYCVLLIIANVWLIISYENVKFKSSDIFTQITSRIKLKVNIITYVAMLTVLLLNKSKSLENAINSFREIARIFDDLHIRVSYSDAKNILMVTIVLEFLLNVIQLVCLHNLLGDGALRYYIQTCLPTNFCNFLIHQVETYVFLTWSFLKRTATMINNTKYCQREKEIFTRNFLTFPTRKIRQDYVPFIKLVHMKLYMVSVWINETFSLVLLFYIANCFVSIFSLSFFTWRGFFYNGNHFYSTTASGTTTTRNIRDASHYIFMIVSILLSILHILILCYFCQRAHNENENIKFVLYDKNVNSNVFQLSLQSIHEDIRFSAGNFFDIDFNLLTMMFSAITTYLLILIQFDKKEHTISNYDV